MGRPDPPGFLFAVKASRYLTHVRRLHTIDEGIGHFYEPLQPMIGAGRLGPVLWQLPENFHRDDTRLREWLSALERAPSRMHTIEFRHASWFAAPVLDALRERGVALTIGDHPSRPFQVDDATAGWRFVRFPLGHAGRRGNYSRTELAEWAARIAAWRRETDVYAYFNNDWEGFAPANERLLERLVGQLVAETTGTPKRSSSPVGSTPSR